MNTPNQDELISSAIDGELSTKQLDELMGKIRADDTDDLMVTWENYHVIGDVLRSDDLSVEFSSDFARKFSARLDAEPTILAPANSEKRNGADTSKNNKRTYWGVASIAAMVMLGVMLAPQISPLLKPTGSAEGLATKVEQPDPFTLPSVKLASNSNGNASSSQGKEGEFASKLESQVEMLRDPRLDSYLLAHQKVSPSFDNGARFVQRANVVSSPESTR